VLQPAGKDDQRGPCADLTAADDDMTEVLLILLRTRGFVCRQTYVLCFLLMRPDADASVESLACFPHICHTWALQLYAAHAAVATHMNVVRAGVWIRHQCPSK
jgi:hypothetical protein